MNFESLKLNIASWIFKHLPTQQEMAYNESSDIVDNIVKPWIEEEKEAKQMDLEDFIKEGK